MKRLFASLLIVSLFGNGVQARCNYFRLSADLLKCEAVDAAAYAKSNPYQDVQDLPEIPDAKSQSLVQVSCSCEYSLSGSDPRCDLEQTSEKSSVIGVDSVDSTCRRGKILCRDVCPSNLL